MIEQDVDRVRFSGFTVHSFVTIERDLSARLNIFIKIPIHIPLILFKSPDITTNKKGVFCNAEK